MKREDYENYLVHFNARDYESVLSHFAERFDLSFAGYHFRTKDEVRNFYRFLHSYVDEFITLEDFVGGPDFVAIEAVVRLTAKQDLSQEILDEEGFGRLGALMAGQSVAIPQYIHYHLEDGKIIRAGCALP